MPSFLFDSGHLSFDKKGMLGMSVSKVDSKSYWMLHWNVLCFVL